MVSFLRLEGRLPVRQFLTGSFQPPMEEFPWPRTPPRSGTARDRLLASAWTGRISGKTVLLRSECSARQA